MTLRINDGPFMKGTFKNNFTVPQKGNEYPVFVHQQKRVGNNFELVKSGKIGIKPTSKAQECIEQLIFGCGRIDILQSPERCIACFRDAKVLVSRYLEIDEIKEVNAL